MSDNQHRTELQAAALGEAGALEGLDSRRLAEVKRRICAIGVPGRHVGTGFLVGPRAVLTNCHVFEEARRVGNSPLFCVFDFDTGRPFDELPRDVLNSEPLALSVVDGLDYAILELKADPGINRGWIELASLELVRDQPIQILGHPAVAAATGRTVAARMTHTLGALSDSSTLTRRLAYTTRTAPGSSGSPVFTETLELIGLHQSGEAGMNNHGIPAWAILEDLVGANEGECRLDLVKISPRSNRPLAIPASRAGSALVQRVIPEKLRKVGSKTGFESTGTEATATPVIPTQKPLPPTPRMELDRTRFLQRMERLTAIDMGSLIMHLPECRGFVANHAPVLTQISQLVAWADGVTGPGLQEVARKAADLWPRAFGEFA